MKVIDGDNMILRCEIPEEKEERAREICDEVGLVVDCDGDLIYYEDELDAVRVLLEVICAAQTR